MHTVAIVISVLVVVVELIAFLVWLHHEPKHHEED